MHSNDRLTEHRDEFPGRARKHRGEECPPEYPDHSKTEAVARFSLKLVLENYINVGDFNGKAFLG